jgi:hypothetical protein
MPRSVKTRSRWLSHPIIAGLIVAAIVGIVGLVFSPLMYHPASIIGTASAPAPSPKTNIEVRTVRFTLPGVHVSSYEDITDQFRRDLVHKYRLKNNMKEFEAEIEASKFLKTIDEIEVLKNILKVAGAEFYNFITIENKGTADDKNIVLNIGGIRFVADMENNPNAEWENQLIKIKLMRPGDKIYLEVWTNNLFLSDESKRFRASSDAGVIALSVH